MDNSTHNFDVIVIGSGMGGLTVAGLLAKMQNKKVLVLEQHFTPGGFTHGFERKGKFHWDVGLHYVGEMGENSLYRAVFNYLTNGQLKWHKMPHYFDKFVYPDFTFQVSEDVRQFQRDLVAQFPHEETAIRQYFQDVQRAAFWLIALSMVDVFPRWLRPILHPLFHRLGAIAKQTTQTYLDQHFQDKYLKALLVSQWGDYGLPPSKSCFGIHGVVVTHYFEGGWHPIGGGTAIAQHIIPTIEKAGGKIITQRKVTEIVVDAGVATGVKVQNAAHPDQSEEVYRAPVIVSNAGIFNTYQKLIPASIPLPHRQSIQNFPKGCLVSVLYLGLKTNPQSLGFQGENHWIYNSYDHETIGQRSRLDAKYLPQSCYLTFPSLKDPSAKGHTAEIITYANYDWFLAWQHKTWKKRGQDYLQFKAEVTDILLDFVEYRYPGFRELIEYSELSTPLTFEHFASSHQGAIYGIPCTPERLDQPWVSARTPIKNLYLTGTDTFVPGIVGALMGGIKTASILNGVFGFPQILTKVMGAKTGT